MMGALSLSGAMVTMTVAVPMRGGVALSMAKTYTKKEQSSVTLPLHSMNACLYLHLELCKPNNIISDLG